MATEHAVAETLRRRMLTDIGAGTLPPGARLGSERELSEHYGVSRATLRQVLAALEEAGLVRRVAGRGQGLAFQLVGELHGLAVAGGVAHEGERVVAAGHAQGAFVHGRRLLFEGGFGELARGGFRQARRTRLVGSERRVIRAGGMVVRDLG